MEGQPDYREGEENGRKRSSLVVSGDRAEASSTSEQVINRVRCSHLFCTKSVVADARNQKFSVEQCVNISIGSHTQVSALV